MDGMNTAVLRGVVTPADLRSGPKRASGEFHGVFEELKSTGNPTMDPKKIVDAARSFEALMIGQVLKAAHGDGSGSWLGAGDDDETASTAIQMAEEYLGQ